MKWQPGNTAVWWIRLALGAGALAVVAWFIEPSRIITALADAQGGALATAVLLLAPNLWFQFRKWRYLLLTNGYRLTNSVVWHSLLYGFAFGIVTPARVGEFGGRLVAAEALQNTRAPGLVAADKFSAMIVTVSFGLFAAAVWGLHFDWFGYVPATLGMGIAVVFPFIAWRAIRLADARITRTQSAGLIARVIDRFSEATRLLSPAQYRMMLLYSTGFYLTFVSQFSILLLAFEKADIIFTALGVACVMVAKTIVPPVTLGELGIREGFTVFFLAMIGMSPASAFSASVLLFLINILTPSAFGGLLLLRSTFSAPDAGVIAFPFLAVYVGLLGVYALFLFRMRKGMQLAEQDTALYAEPAPGASLPAVSVLIPMRNERANIPALLASLAAQEYPDDRLQILCIDDHSTDNTGLLVEQRCSEMRATNISCLRLDAGVQGKKAAISFGVGHATGEIILTTDADCTHGEQWVKSMVVPFTHDADIVAGPVVIAERGSLFARLQALDFLGLMGVGAGFFGIGFPRLCNGANLAYRKSMFHKADGFAGNEGMSSGDDEFLLHKIAYELRGNAVFTADARTVVQTPPVVGLWKFLMQRSRWASKGARYADGGFVAFMVLLFVFYFLSALLPGVAILSAGAFLGVVVVFLVKSWIELATLVAAARLLQQPIRIIDFIVAELLHPFYLVIVTIAGTVGVGTWKGRKLETNK